MNPRQYLLEVFWPTVLDKSVENTNPFIPLRKATNYNYRTDRRVGDRLLPIRRQFDRGVARGRYPLADHCFLHDYDKPELSNLIHHHIIMLSNWGTNDRYNVITLCEKCHEYMHPWLRTTREKREMPVNTQYKGTTVNEMLVYVESLETGLSEVKAWISSVRDRLN